MDTVPSYKSGVLVVGGGPAGLAAALMLSKRGWTDITVLEQNSSVQVLIDVDIASIASNVASMPRHTILHQMCCIHQCDPAVCLGTLLH